MIDLNWLSRITFRRSTSVHAVTAGTMRTACGRSALLHDTWDRRTAVEPLPPETPVTCRHCLAPAAPRG